MITIQWATGPSANAQYFGAGTLELSDRDTTREEAFKRIFTEAKANSHAPDHAVPIFFSLELNKPGLGRAGGLTWR